ncbi:two-component sensor histidine kinase [Bacillus sp. M6-12]|uniref:PAS domain-containing sensor histidine kinase n=1 Tax=Bacillus sp. M6-12 TaxID=2054166 RepID=UPI000C786E37|nr:PAS domain-containing sensor histidine kinase [Bacillus sp. M6-12]PLS16453.1 two-component sensor histidine kinase [Bacillus sp. M6-12]
MKNKQLNLYVLAVVLPVLLSLGLFLFFSDKAAKHQQAQRAEWIGSIHLKYLDQLIGETKSRLEILALSGSAVYDEPKQIKDLLAKAERMDPRFGGMYWINSNGEVKAATNNYLPKHYFQKDTSIQGALLTKTSIVASQREKWGGHFRYFTVTTPVLDEQDGVKGYIIACLRLDYIENVMGILTPEVPVLIEDKTGEPIMTINKELVNKDGSDYVSLPVDDVSWTMKIQIPSSIPAINYQFLINFMLTVVAVAHILFLFIKYLLLKREARMQQKLIDAQKLEVVGTLAASTAHEIKNPLTGIKGLIQLLKEKHIDQEDQFYFSVIMEEISRINDIVSEFIILGKPAAPLMSVMDIREVASDLAPIIESEARLYNAEFHLSLPSDPLMVSCSKDQLKQVILNVSKNGFEALREQGALNISLSKKDTKVYIVISDNGIGISEAEIERVFDPFYTSKKSGTGLGLLICKRIVELFHGTISISSQENEGTQVAIILPVILEK